MTHLSILTTVAVLLSTTSLALGLPQGAATPQKPVSKFRPWSSHPDCAAPATACKSDCTRAVDKLCRQDLTQENLIEKVGDCTAWYLFQPFNTAQTYETCYNTFASINDAGKPGPGGCGGSFGGALGWDANGDRTYDPAFAIYPSTGNANCMITETPSSPPLKQNMLKDNMTEVPIDSCPSTAVSRRQLPPQCFIEDGAWIMGCTAVCVAWVASLTWWTFGTGAAIGLLPCLGGCDATGFKLYKNCEKSNPDHAKLKHRRTLGAPPSAAEEQKSVCDGTEKVAFECPAVRTILLAFNQCTGKNDSEGREMSSSGTGAGTSGTGTVHF
ncbi:MAG: hypothetical protein Q9168_004769 [Polycauliona sp. 1 TL-2023]